MTTTIVYGDVSDGYLHSLDPAYATARGGPADGVNSGGTAFYGQNNNGGTYAVFQTFVRFTFPAVAATEVVASAALHLSQLSQLSTGTVRDLEVYGYNWRPTLEVADWQTPAGLAGLVRAATVRGVQASQGVRTLAGSEVLRASLAPGAGVTNQDLVLASSRQRVGSTPTTDEGSSIATADASGTSSDPALVFTTVTDHALIPVMGAEVQLSDGSWVFLTAAGAATVDLFREEATVGAATPLASFPLGPGAGQWADVPAAQGFTLAVDAADNIYVVGRAGDGQNSVQVRALIKAPGSWTWTLGIVRTIPLPAHDSPLNNVTASWSPAGGGTVVVFASHTAGDGVSGGADGDVAYVLINSQYILDGSGSLLRAIGSATTAGILFSADPSGYFSGYVNESGSGLDVTQDYSAEQSDWGYLVSFRRDQALGGNGALQVGRFNLNSTATGFDFTEPTSTAAFGTKDASAKIRAIAVGAAQVAMVTADADAGWGLSVQVFQSNGNVAGGLVYLGFVHLGGEGIPSMPDGPAVKSSLAWDAVYSVTENAVWVYYVSATDSRQLMRTSVSLNTYQATRVEVPVYNTGANPILGVRVPRNARVTQRGHVTVATSTGYARIQDTFNQAPLAPTLTARANYDATTAATFAWTFQDPNSGDTQSAYQLQVVRVSDGVTVLDTGKVLSAVTSRSVAGGTLANGQSYQWRVMTWDALGVAGPWSGYGTFTTSAGGSVNITTPAVDNPPGAITDDYQVTWSVTGTAQAKYRAWVTRGDTGATVFDSGWVASAATTTLVAGLASDVEHTVSVQVENASAIRSGIGTRKVTPSYGTPEVPLVTLTPVPDGGYVLVSVDNPLPQGDRPEVVRNRIFRRPVGDTGPWAVLGECEPDGSFRDYTVPSQTPVEYVARGETA